MSLSPFLSLFHSLLLSILHRSGTAGLFITVRSQVLSARAPDWRRWRRRRGGRRRERRGEGALRMSPPKPQLEGWDGMEGDGRPDSLARGCVIPCRQPKQTAGQSLPPSLFPSPLLSYPLISSPLLHRPLSSTLTSAHRTPPPPPPPTL